MKVVQLTAGSRQQACRSKAWSWGRRPGLCFPLPCVCPYTILSLSRASGAPPYLCTQVEAPAAPSGKPQKQQEKPASVPPPPGDLSVGDLGDLSVDKAAVKIQAAFKGYKVRKEIQQQEGPVFCHTFGDTVAQVGDVLRLECVVSSKTDVHAHWLKDGVRLTDGRHHHIDQLGDGTCSLLVTSLGRADAGHYTCQVSNKFGRVAHSACVVVSGMESETESSSGTELDDNFRRAARRLHRLFRTKGPAEVSDEEIFSADKGKAEPEEPGDWQTYREDEQSICIRFETLAEARRAATCFRDMFGTLDNRVDISLSEQGLHGVEMRIGKVAPTPAAPPEPVLAAEAGESASCLGQGSGERKSESSSGDQGQLKTQGGLAQGALASGCSHMQPTELGGALTLGLDRAQLKSPLCLLLISLSEPQSSVL